MIGQDMGDLERKSSLDGPEETDDIICIFRVIYGQIYQMGTAFDGDIQVASASFSIRGLQLFWKMLYIERNIPRT